MYNEKIFTLAFIALTLLATACGKNNNDNPSTPQNDAKKALIGTWKIEKLIINNIEVDRTECEKKSYIILSENTFSTYNFSDKKCDEPKKQEGTYSISNNVLTLTSNGRTSKPTFSISGNNLLLSEVEKNEFGETRTVKQILIKQ
ncbi:hypothetical protein HMPREF9078_01429 [Capnocytophaga sp. oral taxon 380 str. F0488]|nr:hypothetical protein HMPREF9078_01429 [Capnocytophaga sp. oral taxon 380 str. F0488]